MLNEVPIGTVCPFAGQIHPVTGDANNIFPSSGCSSQDAQAGSLNADIPIIYPEASGWMLCDGRYLEIDAYPELFAVIGTLYGTQGNDKFRLPDYRGLFMRGVDAGSGLDPEAAERIGPDGTGKSSGIGSLQCDAFQEHQHNYNTLRLSAQAQQGPVVVGGIPSEMKQTNDPPNNPARISMYKTRPKNISVNYIIKYR
ncbi:phage tail protein [Moorena producens JHB]|uniref:Phage tail protein n=1 Tax=Moorena producens (strain JHB) TaxID=1454205 RepID=A0A1D9GAT6_MOOP1|nr:phage tail protein [Moorena producens]AOY84644.2 phage tail protein [Moorena producens JHB]